MQSTPLLQETTVACLNGVKETQYKLSEHDLSLLSSHLMVLVTRQLSEKEAKQQGTCNQDLLHKLDYPDR